MEVSYVIKLDLVFDSKRHHFHNRCDGRAYTAKPIELMLNAVNLSFIAFSHYLNSVDGQMFVFLVLTVAAAEVVVGLAIIVSIFRTRRDIDVDDMNVLRG